MRRTPSFVVVLALALLAAPAALADAASPAAEPAAAAPAALPAFAAAQPSPAEPAGFCPTTDPLGNPAAEPSFVTAGPCYVERLCDDGSMISCNGASSCGSGPGTGGGYVTCDGVTTWCPQPPPPPVCPDGEFCKYNGTVCGECDGAPCYCYNRACICL